MMRKLAIPQTYMPAAGDEAPELRVIAVKPMDSVDTALKALLSTDPESAAGLGSLASSHPELAAVLWQLIDELDGLACRDGEQGLVPLVGKPLWENLPIVWPEAGADGAPDLDTVAEWLVWFGGDAQRWWGGLEVTTDRGTWQLGEARPVRTILEGATACRITRRPEAAEVMSLVLSRLPTPEIAALRQAITAISTVRALEAPLRTGEARGLLRSYKSRIELGVTVRPRLAPPPASAQPLAKIALTHLLHPDTPANPDELSSDIERHNAEVRSFVLLAPLGDAAALDEAVPPESDARYLLDGVVLADRELASPVLRIADHLDGLARMTMMGPIPMLGVILHAVLSRLVRSGKTEPWDQVAAFDQGLRTTFFQHLLCVRVETPSGDIWTAGRSVRLREVVAGHKRCTISRPEEPYRMIGHAGLDWRIAEDLFCRGPR